MLVAIHPDGTEQHQHLDAYNASSPRWAEILQRVGHDIRWVDVYRHDILEQLRGCDGLMWRWKGTGNGSEQRLAHRLLPVVERTLGMAVFPNQDTCWHYDDKVAQSYLLQAARVPTPKTWVFWDPASAREWAAAAEYPLVLKLADGASSGNVELLQCRAQAERRLKQLFGSGLFELNRPQPAATTIRQRVKSLYRKVRPAMPSYSRQLHRGYVLFQEFLPLNDFDTRVTVIGNRAFAFRRFNRDGDFRASGSGKIDFTVGEVDERFVRMAFDVAMKLRMQSVAIDGLYQSDQPVLVEVSYTYVSWAVQKCPGHWRLEGDPGTGHLEWVPGQMWPEEAQVDVFLQCLQ